MSRLFRAKAQVSAVRSSAIPKTVTTPIARHERQPKRGPNMTITLTEMLPKFSAKEIEILTQLKYSTKIPLFDFEKLSELTEIIGYLREVDFPENGIVILAKMSEGSQFNIWSLPNIMEYEEQYRLNIKMEFAKRGGTILRDRICPKCRGNEFLVLEAQLASPDEPSAVFYNCVKCY